MSIQPVPSGTTVSVSLSVPGTTLSSSGKQCSVVQGGAAAISIEKGTIQGQVFSTGNTSFIAALKTFAPNGGILRIGGNSVDDSNWQGTGPGGKAGQVQTGDIDNLVAFIKAIGNWKLLYGVNLGGSAGTPRGTGTSLGSYYATTPAKASAELGYLVSSIGAANLSQYLYGYEIGNECNVYNHGSWFTLASYSVSGTTVTFTGNAGGVTNSFAQKRNYFYTAGAPVTGAIMTFASGCVFSPPLPGVAGQAFSLLSGAVQGSATTAASFSITVSGVTDGQTGTCQASVSYGISSGQPALDGSYYFNRWPIWDVTAFATLWTTFNNQVQADNPALKPYCTGPQSAMEGNDYKYWTIPFAQSVGGPAQGGPLQVITQHQGYGASVIDGFLCPPGFGSPYSGQPFHITVSSALQAQAVTNGSRWRFSETESSNSSVTLASEYVASLWVIDFAGITMSYNGDGIASHGQGYLGGPLSNSPLYAPFYFTYSGGKFTGPLTAINSHVYGQKFFDLAGTGPMLTATLGSSSLNMTTYAIQNSSAMQSVIVTNKGTGEDSGPSHAFVTLTSASPITSATLIQMTQGTGIPDLTYPEASQNPTTITIQGSNINLSTGAFSPGAPYSLSPSGKTVTFYVPYRMAVMVVLTTGTSPTITTTSPLTPGTVSTAYSLTLAASGGTTPYTWSVTSGSLPSGLALSSSGVLSGTPTTSGTSSFVVTATDANLLTGTLSASLVIAAAVSITTSSPLTSGVVGTAYSLTFAATGGTSPYTWSVTSGSLPSGLSLSSGGTLSGTPAAAGTSSFTIGVADSASHSASLSASLKIAAAASTLSITTTSPLPAGQVGVSYSLTLAATGGTTPYTWSTSGSLPSGLSRSSGVISGTPTAAGTYGFTIKVTDSASITKSLAVSQTVSPATLAISTSSPLTGGMVGTAYTFTLMAAGGTPAYTWTITAGSLPSGLTLSGAVISGTPTAQDTSSLTVKVADSGSQTATRPVTLAIASSPLIIVSSQILPAGQIGVPYSVAVLASGGTSPYVWSSSGNLPLGMTLNSATGIISGTPSQAVTSRSVIITVTDSSNNTAMETALLTIGLAPLTATGVAATSSQVGNNLTANSAAAGGSSPYTWALSPGSALPSGLTLASNGTVSGTPVVPGIYSFSTVVTDSSATPEVASVSNLIQVAPAQSNETNLPYSWLTLQQAVTALQGRLSNSTFWTVPELIAMLCEALRTWNSLTETWKQSFQFTADDSSWINIGTLADSPRLRTVVDSQLIAQMQYHLLEPPSGTGAWTGTAQFNLAALQGALSKRRDEMIQAANCNMALYTITPTQGPNTRRNAFPDTVLEPQRIRFIPDPTVMGPITLKREDTMASQFFDPTYLQDSDLPSAWSVATDAPLAFVTDVAPSIAGTFDVVALQSGLVLAPGAGTLLGVPDDWSYAAKWGALGDILNRDSEATDVERADYCMKKFNQSLEVMKQSNWLIGATINGQEVETPAMWDQDRFYPEWQSNVDSWPSVVQGGMDFIAPCPNASQSVGLTVVGNMPIPILLSDYVQVSRDVFAVILSYSQFLCAFKMGGQEWNETRPLEQDFYSAAKEQNGRLAKMGIFTDVINTTGKKEDEAQPR